MPKISVTLQALEGLSSSKAAYDLHKRSIKLPQVPLPGDFIKDPEIGYAEVARVVYDVDGNITLVIK